MDGLRRSDGGGTDPLAIDETFALLGNEHRLAILRTLWEAYDPLEKSQGLSFSALFEASDLADSGQFNYHLDKLWETYVEKTDGDYRLTPVGLRLVQSVVAGATRKATFGPTEIDIDCWNCGSATAVQYTDGRFYHVCTGCRGNFDDPSMPEGTISGQKLPPAGLANRSPEDLFATVAFRERPRKALVSGGVCPQCSGVLDSTVDICDDHETAEYELCSVCGYVAQVRVEWVCTVCKFYSTATPAGMVTNHPAVIAFFHDHGLTDGEPYSPVPFERIRALEADRRDVDVEYELRARDPVRIDVRFRYDGDELGLRLDEEMSVVEVRK